MANHISRAKYLKKHPKARAIAALDRATNAQKKVTPGAVKLKQGGHKGETAVILGSGVAGLTTAYELLTQNSGMEVIVLEAQNRTGGRCLSLRTGDTLTEDQDSELFNSAPGETQVVRFKRPLGDAEPYLNAGPGRIPSGHKRLLHYLKKFGVDIEVYVMNSESNLVHMKAKDSPFGGDPVVYRRLNHNTRGWIAQMVFENAAELIKTTDCYVADEDVDDRAEKLKELMISFGELDENGKYVVTAGEDGLENGKTRAGYTELPGVAAGEAASAISLEDLLASEFWEKTKFYQPVDFLWQPTLFQPVGGMDQVQHAFAQQVAASGGTIHLNSPVKSVDWDEAKQKFIISVAKIGTEQLDVYEADYCFSNIAMPFLEKIVSDELQESAKQGFDSEFKAALKAVYYAQSGEMQEKNEDTGQLESKPRPANKKFLACTTKVGWQADRTLWQGADLLNKNDAENTETNSVPDSEVGVVPIFGGISWTENDITQIWYPSTGYHDQKGILTGAYNFDKVAAHWGTLSVSQRLDQARREASDFGQEFGAGLHDGLAIAWQNMPYIKGGWAQWDEVQQPELHFNHLTQGTAITNSDGTTTKGPRFFIVGDQISSLPGWQEGAIASALNALSRMERPDLAIPHLAELPNTKLMVEGI